MPAPRCGLRLRVLGAKHAPDRDSIEIDAIEAANVDCPDARVGARSAKRLDAAGRAEIVARRPCVERIERQVFERRQQAEIFWRHAEIERAAPPADRAVADTDMVEVGVDLISHATAMAGAVIGLFHPLPFGRSGLYPPIVLSAASISAEVSSQELSSSATTARMNGSYSASARASSPRWSASSA